MREEDKIGYFLPDDPYESEFMPRRTTHKVVATDFLLTFTVGIAFFILMMYLHSTDFFA